MKPTLNHGIDYELEILIAHEDRTKVLDERFIQTNFEGVVYDVMIARLLFFSPLNQKEKMNEFIRLTGKSQATFYRYINWVLGKTKTMNTSLYVKNYIGKYECYFCKKNNKLCFHHIDSNRKNNAKENIVCLCYSCHIKLHYLLRCSNE